jgi:large subunit ribosomal protein L3
MQIGLLGRKVGMTRLYDESGKATCVTVIEAGANTPLELKSKEKHGYVAVQVGYDDQKPQRLTKSLRGVFEKYDSGPKKRIREFRLGDDIKIEGELDLSVKQFSVGDWVDVIGQSKGKGFQGVVKKHGMAGQPATHGSMMHRRNGAIGNRSTPGRIWKNMGMPGRMGNKRVTVSNLRVAQVREAEGLIVVTGAIPGANGSYVVVRPAKRKSNMGGAK